jgi:hypothetical protein
MTDHDPETGEVMTVPQQAVVEKPSEPMQMPSPFSGPTDKIDKAIAAITSEATPVDKGGYNDFHKYKYSRIEDYVEVIAPLIGKHGLAVYETAMGRNEIGGMVYVDYAFYISLEGQRIGPLKFTGMARARDSRGNFDPACIAKTLTAARKQFYTAQFHLKSEDGGGDALPRSGSNARTPIQPPQEQPLPSDVNVGRPHTLMLGKKGWEDWSRLFLQIIRTCDNLDLVEKWLDANTSVLDMMRKENEPHHQFVMRQYHKRVRELQPGEPTQ